MRWNLLPGGTQVRVTNDHGDARTVPLSTATALPRRPNFLARAV
jgi:hypothetical protein